MNQRVKLGKSRYTIFILAGFLLGIFFADKITLSFLLILLLIFITAYIIYLFRAKPTFLLIGFSLISLLCGIFYYRYWDYKENQKKISYNQLITFNGKVSERPNVSGSNQQLIVNYNTTKILIQTSKYPEFQYGDILEITGKISNPANAKTSSDFNYGEYLIKKGIRGQVKNPEKVVLLRNDGNFITKKIYLIGDKFNNSIIKVLPEPYAAFQIGILFGNKTSIPDSLMSAFNRTGTTHIVAVSGYNLTIIITSLALIFALFSRRAAFFGTIFTIIFFIILTGAPASVLRAGLLAGLVSFSRLSGRRPFFPILILFAANLMLLFNPYALKNDVSFQLSFLAFIGLVLVSPVLENISLINKLPKIIKIAFCETMGAQIMVAPILLYNFGILSIIAPLSNILILPLIPLTMFMGFATGFAGIILGSTAKIFSIFAYILLKYIILITEKLSVISWAAISIKASEWWWIPCYYLLIFWWIQHQKNSNIRSGSSNNHNF